MTLTRMCRCGLDLTQTDDPAQQMAMGLCHPCQRKRHAAAVAYIRACDITRLLQQVAAARGDKRTDWVSSAQGHAVADASAALTAAGLKETRVVWTWRQRGDAPWH